MKTVLTGTHQPDQPQSKRTRRSPKKRRSEKSEAATPEFGTISLDKPSHGKPTKATKPPTANDVTEAVPFHVHVPYTQYHRELRKARNHKNDVQRVRVREAEVIGMAIGIVIGVMIGFGAWWLVSLF
jgi:hypothetical protein